MDSAMMQFLLNFERGNIMNFLIGLLLGTIFGGGAGVITMAFIHNANRED